ncbi:hypothetical protein RY831_14725 [Noviherbaspirillum sp. CPCC 100848]|uniref:Uncharacterized protein n=1 Tax=Noviherbaspirillum album TaxID=3080276 RepID=A0ABU6J9T7_9BURK|nr:hypothetical protein [Noviherbaspirillum sp. CPCC 100848]MEC4720414.1 hypothetical protein [Noviherbaspirillum sp. CPCC 100848]
MNEQATYHTKHMLHLIDRYPLGKEDPDPFVRHLYETAESCDNPFSQIMGEYAGNPVGIEFRQSDGERWAFVLPDASEPGRFRVQYFDSRGFSGHFTHNDLVAAVEDMVRSGYRVKDIGALDRLSETRQWAAGIESSDLITRLNSGKIDFAEFATEQQAIAKKYALA